MLLELTKGEKGDIIGSSYQNAVRVIILLIRRKLNMKQRIKCCNDDTPAHKLRTVITEKPDFSEIRDRIL